MRRALGGRDNGPASASSRNQNLCSYLCSLPIAATRKAASQSDWQAEPAHVAGTSNDGARTRQSQDRCCNCFFSPSLIIRTLEHLPSVAAHLRDICFCLCGAVQPSQRASTEGSRNIRNGGTFQQPIPLHFSDAKVQISLPSDTEEFVNDFAYHISLTFLRNLSI